MMSLKSARAIAGAAVLAAALAGPASVAGQHGHGPGPHAGGPQQDPHRRVQEYEEEFERVVAQGRGFGMAFAADRNGYPGPQHVLELGERLRLTTEQQARVRALMDAMLAEARPKSARLLEAERRLRDLFANGRADEASVQAAVAEAERARAEVRLVHLRAHLATRALLTEEQRRIYHEARWGR